MNLKKILTVGGLGALASFYFASKFASLPEEDIQIPPASTIQNTTIETQDTTLSISLDNLVSDTQTEAESPIDSPVASIPVEHTFNYEHNSVPSDLGVTLWQEFNLKSTLVIEAEVLSVDQLHEYISAGTAYLRHYSSNLQNAPGTSKDKLTSYNNEFISFNLWFGTALGKALKDSDKQRSFLENNLGYTASLLPEDDYALQKKHEFVSEYASNIDSDSIKNIVDDVKRKWYSAADRIHKPKSEVENDT